MPSNDRIVLILGMHRSGTSLLARLLAAQGLPLGTDLLDRGQQDNAHGYWEQAEIVAIHEALLDGYDRTWHGPNGLRPLPDGWLRSPEAALAKSRLAAIARREVIAGGGLWGFKDPRTLRLLLLWQEIIAELGLDPVFILAARAPAAVAGSLMRRNRMSRHFAEALWAANTLEVLDAVGRDLAAVVDYDAWFDRPHDAVTRHLRAVVGLPTEERARPEPIAPLIEPRLRHHTGSAGDAHPAFRGLHAALVSVAPRSPPDAILAPAIDAAKAALVNGPAIRTANPIVERWRKFIGLAIM